MEVRTGSSPTSCLYNTGRVGSKGQLDGAWNREASELLSDSNVKARDEPSDSSQDLAVEESVGGTHFYMDILDAHESNYD